PPPRPSPPLPSPPPFRSMRPSPVRTVVPQEHACSTVFPVGGVDPGRPYPDEDLPGPRVGPWQIDLPQYVGTRQGLLADRTDGLRSEEATSGLQARFEPGW